MDRSARTTLAALTLASATTLAGCSFSFHVGSGESPTSSSTEATLAEDTPPSTSAKAAPAAGQVSCGYSPQSPVPEKVDPKQFESQGDATVEQAKKFNDQVDQISRTKKTAPLPNATQPATGTAKVTFTIDGRPVEATLDRRSAPCTVAGVLHLVEQKYYDGNTCHRLTVPSGEGGLAVLQCGDPTGTGMSGPGYVMKDEPPTSLKAGGTTDTVVYPRGTLAMAKSQQPNSAGSQFFVVYKDSELPPTYAVLGKIDEAGLGVVDAIAARGVKSQDPRSEDNQHPASPVALAKAVVS